MFVIPNYSKNKYLLNLFREIGLISKPKAVRIGRNFLETCSIVRYLPTHYGEVLPGCKKQIEHWIFYAILSRVTLLALTVGSTLKNRPIFLLVFVDLSTARYYLNYFYY